MKKALIVSTSPRKGGNSDVLAQRFADGARESGCTVEKVELFDKSIAFCRGCFACQRLGKCVIDDYANELTEKMLEADVICFATPVYYYTMCGQMKTIIDRANSMFKKDYRFRDIYIIASADDPEPSTMDGVKNGVECWLRCYPKASVKGTLLCGGIEEIGAVYEHPEFLQAAFDLGKSV